MHDWRGMLMVESTNRISKFIPWMSLMGMDMHPLDINDGGEEMNDAIGEFSKLLMLVGGLGSLRKGNSISGIILDSEDFNFLHDINT